MTIRQYDQDQGADIESARRQVTKDHRPKREKKSLRDHRTGRGKR